MKEGAQPRDNNARSLESAKETVKTIRAGATGQVLTDGGISVPRDNVRLELVRVRGARGWQLAAQRLLSVTS